MKMPRFRLRTLMVAVAIAGLVYGLIAAFRVYEVRTAPQTVRVLKEDANSATLQVSTGVSFVPGFEPVSGALAAAVIVGLIVAWRLRRRVRASG
jgi:hypothetical protein